MRSVSRQATQTFQNSDKNGAYKKSVSEDVRADLILISSNACEYRGQSIGLTEVKVTPSRCRGEGSSPQKKVYGLANPNNILHHVDKAAFFSSLSLWATNSTLKPQGTSGHGCKS